MSFNLSTGMKISLTNKRNTDYLYPSRIVEVNNKELSVLGPMKQGRYVYFPIGTNLSLSFKSEVYGHVFFDCVVRDRSKENGYILKLERISDFKTDQSRDNFRVESSLPVKLIYSEGENLNIEETKTLDISAGGIRVYSNLDLKEGEIIECVIKLGAYSVDANVKVIRRLDSKSVNYKNQYALSFVDLEELKEDIIVKYLFDYQRLLSSEGRIDD